MKIRIAGKVNDSIVDGEGLRFTIFTQGCPHHCFNCHNPKTWDFNSGKVIDTSSLIKEIKENPLLDGVTFSGGEPFMQPIPLTELAKEIHEMKLNVWSFTGFTFEELINKNDKNINEMLKNIDVLIDGEYIDSLRDIGLKFRGSSNQRIIDLKKTLLEKNKVNIYLK